MKHDFYVYYKVPAEHSQPVRALVDRILHDVRAETGISGALLRRRDDPATWMEMYPEVADADGFEKKLAEIVARHAFDKAVPAGIRRWTEVFRPF